MKFKLVESVQSEDDWGNQLSKGQQSFFANSKIVSHNSLMVMAHYSQEDFNEFDIDKIGDGLTWGKGFYFGTPDEIKWRYEDSFGDTVDSHIDKVKLYYLNITNPYTIWSGADELKLVNYLNDLGIIKNVELVTTILEYDTEDDSYYSGATPVDLITDLCGEQNQDNVQKWLIDLGFDGVWGGELAVAFYPNQIKLITNLNPTSSNKVDK